ncbi:hypothetical protein Bca52824_068073 [Brassica carinata]|uniref:Uncharacterized protein n=1 Tax=Brassica carinata TaxID=52824 RepID=A0A8X7Q4K4_BRACI|nr:hypothetical protein Bca52824_068073 [Brassica carinata]
MDNYDEEDDYIQLFSSGLVDLYYPSNELDPYLKDAADDDDEDIDDMTFKPTDSVIICARNEDEVSHLEVYVYEESWNSSPNMYVHHHIVSIVELCGYLDQKEKPTIEIWDLDVVCVACLQLGGLEEMKVSKKKKRINKIRLRSRCDTSNSKYKEGSHTISVLGLAWNKNLGVNILASASADRKVKVWDVATGQFLYGSQVQAVAWNHYAPVVLLSGSFDQTVVLMKTTFTLGFQMVCVMSDVESLAWNPHSEYSFVVSSLEDGTVKGFDIRATQSGSDSDLRPSLTIQAHDQDKGFSSISYNISAPNVLLSISLLLSLKHFIFCFCNQFSLFMISVFSIFFSVDNPFLLAIGGSKGELHVWDTLLVLINSSNWL